jgi:hypothetical protein
MTHQQNVFESRPEFVQLKHQFFDIAGGREMFSKLQPAMQAQAAFDDFGGFPRAHERTRKDHVERDVPLPQGVRERFRPLNAPGRERTIRIVFVSGVVVLGGFAVSQDVEFHGSVF